MAQHREDFWIEALTNWWMQGGELCTSKCDVSLQRLVCSCAQLLNTYPSHARRLWLKEIDKGPDIPQPCTLSDDPLFGLWWTECLGNFLRFWAKDHSYTRRGMRSPQLSPHAPLAMLLPSSQLWYELYCAHFDNRIEPCLEKFRSERRDCPGS